MRPAVSMDPALAAQLAGFRQARRELEASVLSLATSVDGRRFSFQASLHGLALQAGGYVVLEDGGSARLGQVITLGLDQLSTELMLPAPAGGAQGNRTQMLIQHARGEGVILDSDFAPFHDLTVRPASAGLVPPRTVPRRTKSEFGSRMTRRRSVSVSSRSRITPSE